MPIHDWSRVEPGIFHDFHQGWTIELRNALNADVLPPGYFAMADGREGYGASRRSGYREPALCTVSSDAGDALGRASIVPLTAASRDSWQDTYARHANRIVIKHALGEVVAVVAIASPGNKSSAHALRSFVRKAEELLRQGINLLVVDLFPPSVWDPQGIHKAIWDQIVEEPFELPGDKPLTAVAYAAADLPTAYVEPLAVGDALPKLPIFLEPGIHVPAPLEASYQTTWAKCPQVIRALLA